jgi:hypothetical protein
MGGMVCRGQCSCIYWAGALPVNPTQPSSFIVRPPPEHYGGFMEGKREPDSGSELRREW